MLYGHFIWKDVPSLVKLEAIVLGSNLLVHVTGGGNTLTTCAILRWLTAFVRDSLRVCVIGRTAPSIWPTTAYERRYNQTVA